MHVRRSLLLLLCVQIYLFATVAVRSGRRSHVDVVEIDESLFPVRRVSEAFAPTDHFEVLSDGRREAWTFAHEMVRAGQGLHRTMLDKIESIRNEGLATDVEVRLIGFERWRGMSKEKLKKYGDALIHGSGKWRPEIRAHIKWAPKELSNEVYFEAGRVRDSKLLWRVLERDSKGRTDTNIVYVIEVADDSSIPKGPTVRTQGGRVAWMLHHVSPSKVGVRFTDMMPVVGKAVTDTFAPLSKYFPVPLIENIRVHIHSYTPRSPHRASWLQGFEWSVFEEAIRSFALRGQRVGFFPTQVNAELPKEALLHLRSFVEGGVFDLDASLKRSLSVNDSWGAQAYKKSDAPLYIYVIDASKILSPAASLMKRQTLTISPGLAIITLKPSARKSKEKLYNLLISAVAGSAFGIDSTALDSFDQSVITSKSMVLLKDIATSHVISSLIDKNLREIELLLSLLTECNLEPNQALTLRTFTYFHQRLNLLLYKVARAKEAFEHGDGDASVHYAASLRHDAQAVRKILQMEHADLEALRRGTPSCRLFHIRDSASFASRILEATISSPKVFWLLVIFCSAFGIVAVRVAVQYYLKSPRMRKRGKYD